MELGTIMLKKAEIFIAGTLIMSCFSGACVPITIEESAASPVAVFTSTIVVIETAEPTPLETSETKQVPTKNLEALCKNEGALGYTLSAEETWGTLDDNIEHLPDCYKRASLSIEGAINRDVMLSSFIEQGAFDGDFPSEYPSADTKLGVPVKVYFKEGSELPSKLDVVATPAPKVTFTPQDPEEYDGPTAEVGLCPVDMSDYGVRYYNSFRTESTNKGVPHDGIDISGPEGYKLKSPHYCKVYRLEIGKGRGAQVISFYCPGLISEYVSFGHVDFSYNDYETLKWYGIPLSSFNLKGIQRGFLENPTKNLEFMEPGEFTHAYMSNTGSGRGIVHVHIETAKAQFQTRKDPCLYLDCCGK